MNRLEINNFDISKLDNSDLTLKHEGTTLINTIMKKSKYKKKYISVFKNMVNMYPKAVKSGLKLKINKEIPLLHLIKIIKYDHQLDFLEFVIDTYYRLNIFDSNDNYVLFECLDVLSESMDNTVAFEAFKIIIEKCCNLDILNQTNEYGANILHIIVHDGSSHNSIKAVKILLMEGMDINKQTTDGATLLQIAVLACNSTSSYKMAKYLIKAGANLDIQNKWKHTALHIALKHTKIKQLVLLLIDYDCDLELTDDEGLTALDYAIYHNWSEDVIELLTGGQNENYQRCYQGLLNNNILLPKKNISDTCTICLDDLDTGRIHLECRHTFHILCLSKWYIEQDSPQCPNCRKIY